MVLQLFRLCSVFSLLLICSAICSASQIVFIRAAGTTAADQRQLEIASRFYGLDLNIISTGPGSKAALAIVKQRNTLAVAIDSHALESAGVKALLQSLDQRGGVHIPLLILGLTTDDMPAILSRWSGGAIQAIGRLAENSGLDYVAGNIAGVTDELSGASLPYRGHAPYFLILADSTPVQQVLAMRTTHGVLPTFVETTSGQQPMFFACAATFQRQDDRTMPGPDIVDAFTAVAPAMMFVKYAAGDHGWHAPHHYANLTIDDPWLREPYGYLDYAKLLAEMKAHNFHTTIAFIPWNYSRSSSDVVSIFRENPERYSIAVHGDNHDHKEFEGFGSAPLAVQAPKLEQALARMSAFQRLTGIPADRVFIFPHSIGEAAILGELKRDNYLATVNSTNVPMGTVRPTDPLFDLRPATTAFYDFPSILRYPAAVEESRLLIAVNTFLDNPLFFYTHQDFFGKGIGAFDGVADEVNAVEPGTEWRSLGYIASHLFLIKQRDASDYDVLSFSSSIDLQNSSARPATYHVTKKESTPFEIQSVTVNGHSISFDAEGGLLHFSVVVPQGEHASTAVLYRNGTNLAAISIARHSARVYLLRTASDFRDIWLSHFNLGEALTAYYYRHNETPLRIIALAALLAAFITGGLLFMFIIVRHRRAVSPAAVRR